MENMSPRRPREHPVILQAVSPAPPASATRTRPSPAPNATAADESRKINVFAEGQPGPAPASGTTPRTKRSREDEDVPATKEVWVQPEPALKMKTSPGSRNSTRQPLGALQSKASNERPVAGRGKPLSSTERIFMQKRAQMEASGGTTPSDRKFLSGGVRNVFATTPSAPTTATPGVTPGERRNVFAPGSAGRGL